MDISAVVNQIIMMLLIMGIGLILRKAKILNKAAMKGISSIVLKVAMPALLFMLLQKDKDSADRIDFLVMAILVFLVLSGMMLFIFLTAKKRLPPDKKAVFAALCALPNAGFMGLPIIHAIYGDRGAVYLAAVVVGMNLSIYLTLEYLITGKPPKPSLMAGNAGLIFTLLALMLYMLRLRLPMPLSAMASQLGSLTTPLSMLLAGARLMDFRLSALKDLSLWFAVMVKLLVMPLLSFVLFGALGFAGMKLGVLTLSFAMASAAASQMYAEREGKSALFAATGVSLCTILCLLSIPMIILLTGLS